MRNKLIWCGLVFVIGVPIVLAAQSPFLQWRGPVYILAGFAGIFGLCLLFFQPLLAGQYLPNISTVTSRMLHRFTGFLLLVTVLGHVIGLWITSPPDVVDVLMFRSPTPFSIWGVVAMWAVFATAALAVFWKKLGISPRIWRSLHMALALIITIGTVVHALLIEGAMETFTKASLCILVLAALFKLLTQKWRSLRLR